MAGRMRAFEWGGTSFGPVDAWPQNLGVAVGLCLISKLPIVLWWGAERAILYNDAAIPFLGTARHPQQLGRPGRDCWRETWDTIGPLLDQVCGTDQAAWSNDQRFFLDRSVPGEEVFARFGCSPIPGAASVQGVFSSLTETTELVLNQRRLETLSAFGAEAGRAATLAEAGERAATVLDASRADIAFWAIYRVDARGVCATLESWARSPAPAPTLPPSVSIDDADGPWPLAAVLRTRVPAGTADLVRQGLCIPDDRWPEGARHAWVLPIFAPTRQALDGLVVLWTSSRRIFDEAYRTFFERVAEHLGAAFSRARITEAGARAELDRLRATEQRFRRYFELGLVGMAMTSPAKGILEVNDELCGLLGYDRDELLRMTWVEMTHPDDRAADLTQFDRVMSGEADGYTLDKRWIRKNGRVIETITAAHCVRKDDGTVDYFVGIVVDTTERRRAEEELRRGEAYLAEAQRLSHTGSWAWKVPSGQLNWSRELFRIYGLDPAHTKPTRETTDRFLHPEDRATVEDVLAEAVRQRTDFEMDYRIVQRDGTVRHLHSLGHPVIDASGELEFFGVVIDTTERKRAEANLQKLEKELSLVSRVTTMGELAASIAHEINQPLGSIANNANACLRFLHRAGGDLERLREPLGQIADDAYRAGEILSRIRALMKDSTPERRSLPVEHVVADVLALAHRELRERRITVRQRLPRTLPSVHGNRVQLQQVLLNLVVNAIESMSAIEDRPRILTIIARSEGPEHARLVRIMVRDSGDGFHLEDRERLFDAFYTTKPHGMGMGLRISRSIVESHGGHLTATTRSGRGAVFHCILPAEGKMPGPNGSP